MFKLKYDIEKGYFMKSALVGYTGFVGSNLASSHSFDALYNSKNIDDAKGTNPDLLIFSGIPAAKYLANVNAKADLEICENAARTIEGINAKKLVLISTVDVYDNPNSTNEDTKPNLENTEAYGRNRAVLEKLVHEYNENALIVRLPGLFGINLKKNFLYDFLTLTPAMLKPEKFEEIAQKSDIVKNAYELAENGFYCLTQKAKTTDKQKLKTFFETNDFNSLAFTDSRAVYQFYYLKNLYNDIMKALENDIKILNLATEPISTKEIYKKLTNGKIFTNEIAQTPVSYDMRSKYSELYKGENGYLYSAEKMLDEIVDFAQNFEV